MKIVGHRGARGLAPENTMAGLRKAQQHGVDEIEFDVRVTKDNIPILHHNPNIVDPSGARLSIHTHNYAELKHHKKDLCTLKEALDELVGNTDLYIDIKPGVTLEPIIKLFGNQGYSRGHIKLGSKSFKLLRQLHSALPAIPTIVIEPWSGIRASYRARKLNTRYIAMNQLWLWRGFIKLMASRGWKLYAYTLNNPVRAKRWQSAGLYAVVTDKPDRIDA